jgi:hypothetical protein
MTKIIAAVFALALGTAHAMPILPHSAEKSASAASAQQASLQNRSEFRMDGDEDEAAPPVHIHHATRSVGKKNGKKPAIKKPDNSNHSKRYSLLLPN